MITVEGKYGTKATVICDSISETGKRILSYEIENPRIILAEENTHRMLSKNSASSRAIPFEKMKGQLTGRPVRFGAANRGMQDGGEHNAKVELLQLGERSVDGAYNPYTLKVSAEEAWEFAKHNASYFAEAFYKAGYHKQVYNRLTEPFQMMKTVVTGTEFENFFWLRKHDAADPTFEHLAWCMWQAREQSTPQLLKAGEWHLPYVGTRTGKFHDLEYFIEGEGRLSLEEAIKVSCARSCAVSFRNTDYGLEKSCEVYGRLTEDEHIHGSAFEHCATPMQDTHVTYKREQHGYEGCVNMPDVPSTWQEGVTHMDRDGNLWSGNFKGWIQYRKLVPGENYAG